MIDFAKSKDILNAIVHPSTSVSLYGRRCKFQEHYNFVTSMSTHEFVYLCTVDFINFKTTVNLKHQRPPLIFSGFLQ